MFDFLLAGKRTRHIKMGISLAASWAWGVSIVVGMQIFQEKGLAAFVIWAAGNSLALLVFGIVALKVKDGLTLLDVTGNRFMHWFAFAIQVFSVLVNLTALKIAALILSLPPAIFAISVCAVVVVYTWWGGLRASIETDVLQFATWMVLLTVSIVMALGRDGLSSAPASVMVNSFGNLGWASWGAFTLVAAPFVDQQFWQRRFALKSDSIKPFAIGTTCFAAYMVLVGLAAFCSVEGVVVGLVILMVAMSTLDSAFMAITCYFKELRQCGKRLTLVVFVIAFLFLLLDIGLLELWTFYSSLRLPVAAFVVYKIVCKK